MARVLTSVPQQLLHVVLGKKRWKADEKAFAMPVRVGTKDNWQVIQPTTTWQDMKTTLKKDQFGVATELYYVGVSKTSL